MKSQCANDELSQQKGSIKEKLPGVPIRFVSTEGFTPTRCAAECAVRFEPVCANTGFFATSSKCFRAD
jgi:hypothetical protein